MRNFRSQETERNWRQNALKNLRMHGEKGRMTSARKRRVPLKFKHPLLVQLFEILDSEQVFVQDVCKRAGVTVNAVGQWRNGSAFPKLWAIEAMLQALGYQLRIAKQKRA